MFVFCEVRSLVFSASTRCWQRIIVFLKICSRLFVVVVVLLSWLYPSYLSCFSIVYFLTSDTVNRCRARKWSDQIHFYRRRIVKGASLPSEYCGCNVWCFVRFGGWFSTRRRVVDRRITVLLSSSWHSKTAELFLWEFPADTTWRWELVVRPQNA